MSSSLAGNGRRVQRWKGADFRPPLGMRAGVAHGFRWPTVLVADDGTVGNTSPHALYAEVAEADHDIGADGVLHVRAERAVAVRPAYRRDPSPQTAVSAALEHLLSRAGLIAGVLFVLALLADATAHSWLVSIAGGSR